MLEAISRFSVREVRAVLGVNHITVGFSMAITWSFFHIASSPASDCRNHINKLLLCLRTYGRKKCKRIIVFWNAFLSCDCSFSFQESVKKQTEESLKLFLETGIEQWYGITCFPKLIATLLVRFCDKLSTAAQLNFIQTIFGPKASGEMVGRDDRFLDLLHLLIWPRVTSFLAEF